MLTLWKKSYYKPRQCVEKQRHYSANKELYSQGFGLPSSYLQLWELDCKEGRVPKNWCLRTVVLSLENKEIKPVSLKGNQPWIFIGKTDDKGEDVIFWSPDVNSWLTGKDPDAGEDWRQENRVSEDKMAWWHHQMQWTWTSANSGRW